MTLLTIYTPRGELKLTARLNSGAQGTYTLQDGLPLAIAMTYRYPSGRPTVTLHG